ncbi:acyltransferase family protein [Microbacterium sp. NPDC057407]|uniref:acyltransferase family protein n=1 Tax=Microbacterium sp. NPDC057407 TaxID=3346120 RepID=UPI003672D7EB
MTSIAPSPRQSRYAGLDGLRAIAVALVVAYHLFPSSIFVGGFVGVDVFFVISGFLITSLLLREHDSTGRIGLVDFWKRRARRLLPALALVVTVCSTLAWIIGGDVLLRVGQQVLGAFTFSYNWIAIAGDTGYFGSATPELFRNFWSLSVEEQFYVLWPLVLPLFLLLPRGAARAGAALALAAASAVWMGVVATAGGDVTRAYFGTDTHAFGILLGVALAFALAPVLSRPSRAEAAASLPGITLPPGWTLVLPPTSGAPATRPRWVDLPAVRTAIGCLGIAGLLGILAVAITAGADTAATFPSALVAVSLSTAAAITAGVWPGSWFGPALDVQPLRWVGDRSYGIYLWHWPLLVLAITLVPGGPAETPVGIGIAVLAVTAAVAELSYRFVETPIRRRGFRACARELAAQLRAGAPGMIRPVSAVTAAVLVLGGTTAAIAAAPSDSTGEAAVAAGQAALDRAAKAARTSPAAEPAPSATPPRPAPISPLISRPSPTPQPTPVTGDQITAIGDSVMLASAPALLARFPGIQVDAAVSRSSWAGPGILESLAASGQLRPYVVVALGTNGPVDPDSLQRMADIVGPDRHLVLVNAYAPRDWIPGVNRDLAAFAETHPGVVVADWSAAIGPRTDLLAGDSIHPGPAGGQVFAETVARSVDAIERERAERRYAAELRLHELLWDRTLPVDQ